MSVAKTTVVLAGAYECVRCGTRVSRDELETLPSPRCASCGFTVFRKVRSATVKQVSAV